ncbi:hypothetical protein ACFXHA_43470 [Nocardia sp. NPDC059240]|uniref:hypothetical protein n=1 Tax=Nocardia sp. NPDC059240 TaxID=3346786 RepID=UPI0036B655E8
MSATDKRGTDRQFLGDATDVSEQFGAAMFAELGDYLVEHRGGDADAGWARLAEAIGDDLDDDQTDEVERQRETSSAAADSAGCDVLSGRVEVAHNRRSRGQGSRRRSLTRRTAAGRHPNRRA